MVEKDSLIFNLGTENAVSSSDETGMQKMLSDAEIERRSKRSNTPTEIKLPKLTNKEINQLRRMHNHVAVHDYGENDDYNMDDAAKATAQRYYQDFAKLRNMKHKIRKLDDYVRAVRQCNRCLDLVANTNGAYDCETFRAKVFSGEIHVYGLYYPTYIGKDKKTLNWDYVRMYIDNPDMDLRELMDTVNGDVLNDIDADAIAPNPEIDQFVQDAINGHEHEIEVVVANKKGQKKFVKDIPDVMEAFENDFEIYRKRHKSNRTTTCGLSGYSSDDDMDRISEEDRKRDIWHDDDIPDISGPIKSMSDLDDRIDALDDYQYRHGKVYYGDGYVTPEQKNDAELKDALDAGGFNIRMLIDCRSKMEKKLSKMRKEEEREHDKLQKKLKEIDDRRSARESGELSISKELKALSKKDKKKKKMKKKHSKKAVSMLMDASGASDDYDSFKDYRSDMTDFT